MSTRHPLVLVIVIALSAGLLTGCSDGVPAAPATSADPLDSPLSQYLLPLFHGVGSEEERRAEYAAIEEATAACMSAQGFDYTPVPWDALDQQGGFPGDWRPDDREWVAAWGYGAVDFPAFDEVMADNAAGDVNTAYYQSLSAGEQAAYSDTLYGPPADIDPNRASQTWDQQGCTGRARHEIYGDSPFDAPDNQQVVDALTAFWSSEFTQPEFDELDAAWSDCMADAGHPGFARQADARESMLDASTQLRQASPTDLSPDDPSMQDLQRKEIELALADLDCREQTDYRARSQQIQYALEDRFIADHRPELDAMVAEAAATSAP